MDILIGLLWIIGFVVGFLLLITSMLIVLEYIKIKNRCDECGHRFYRQYMFPDGNYKYKCQWCSNAFISFLRVDNKVDDLDEDGNCINKRKDKANG